MTGTADTEAPEFHEIYKLDVVVIPTNKPVIRDDRNDLIYKTEEEKWRAVAKDVIDAQGKGQPVLVGTTSVEKSEYLSTVLHKANIPHNVLNAKYHEMEANIVAQAGQIGAVTIATNMAGRGADIMLGGNPPFWPLVLLTRRKARSTNAGLLTTRRSVEAQSSRYLIQAVYTSSGRSVTKVAELITS